MSLQYVIDGYNFINHHRFIRRYKHTKDSTLSLLEFIKTKRLTGSPKNKLIIVFDGFPPNSASGPDTNNAVIIFSRKISADEKIKNIVEQSANRKNMVVVSDDKEIKFIVKSLGAQSMGIEEFIKSKEGAGAVQEEEERRGELNYSQVQEINQELKKLWLK